MLTPVNDKIERFGSTVIKRVPKAPQAWLGITSTIYVVVGTYVSLGRQSCEISNGA